MALPSDRVIMRSPDEDTVSKTLSAIFSRDLRLIKLVLMRMESVIMFTAALVSLLLTAAIFFMWYSSMILVSFLEIVFNL